MDAGQYRENELPVLSEVAISRMQHTAGACSCRAYLLGLDKRWRRSLNRIPTCFSVSLSCQVPAFSLTFNHRLRSSTPTRFNDRKTFHSYNCLSPTLLHFIGFNWTERQTGASFKEERHRKKKKFLRGFSCI